MRQGQAERQAEGQKWIEGDEQKLWETTHGCVCMHASLTQSVSIGLPLRKLPPSPGEKEVLRIQPDLHSGLASPLRLGILSLAAKAKWIYPCGKGSHWPNH